MKIWERDETATKELQRLYLVECRWFGIAIHWINGPSVEEDPHDHPRSFLSIVLRGCYFETRRSQLGWVRHFNYFKGVRWDFHRIISVSEGGCVTLVFEGHKKRPWGFHTSEGWVPWREYLK